MLGNSALGDFETLLPPRHPRGSQLCLPRADAAPTVQWPRVLEEEGV